MTKLNRTIMAASLAAVGMLASPRAQASDPTKYPKTAFDEMKVKKNQSDVRRETQQASAASNEVKYNEEWMNVTRRHYEKTSKTYGADHNLTKDAKSKYDDAVNMFQKAKDARLDAHKDLNAQRQELQKAENDLSKDKMK